MTFFHTIRKVTFESQELIILDMCMKGYKISSFFKTRNSQFSAQEDIQGLEIKWKSLLRIKGKDV